MTYGGWVYIMTNKPRGIPYVGVTADLTRRVHQHKSGFGSRFCKRYNLDKLVHVEEFATIQEAIARETWKRDWKIELIENANPRWNDLSQGLLNLS